MVTALLCSVGAVRCSPAPSADAADSGGLLGELARSGLARTIAPRLSIPFEHRPCFLHTPPDGTLPQTECEVEGAAIPPKDHILDLAARASARVRTEVDPEALHTAALIDLLWADGAGNSLQRSISYLQTAARLADRPAPVLADLAAAYLVRAERTQNPRDLLEAIEAAEGALALEPQSEATRFNLALALDRLGLDGQAAEAWREFLMVDPVSGWAAEARHRTQALAKVREPPTPPSSGASASEIAAYVARAPQEARLFGWDRLLGEWGAAVLEGDSTRADDRLRLAATLGEVLEDQGGDATLADAVRAIRTTSGNRHLMRGLARAHREYAEGRAAYLASDFEQAKRSLAQAVAAAGESHALRAWATIFGAAILVRTGQPEPGAASLRELRERTDPARHPALAAQIEWVLGTAAAWNARYEEATARFGTSADLFARAGENEHLGAAWFHAASQSYLLGDVGAMHSSMHRTLTLLRPYRGSTWLHNALYVWAQAAAELALARAAVRLQDEGVTVAARTGAPVVLVEARLARARLLTAAGHPERAAEDIEAARGLLEKLHSGAARDWMSADLWLAEAGMQLDTHPERAAAMLDQAISFFGSPRNPARLLPAYIARAEIHLRLGRVRSAEEDLDRAVTMLAEQREVIARVPFRASLLDAARQLVDRLVLLRLAAGRPAEALAYLERGRMSFAPVGPRLHGGSPGRLASPPGEIAVEHALVGDTLLIWTVADTTVRFTRITIDRVALLQTIARANSALELRTDEAAARSALASLYDMLIRPVEPQLGPAETPIVWIADGEIAGVPLAALYDSVRQRYLIEDYPLRFTSSLQDAAREQSAWGTSGAKALLIADPAFDARAFPGLERLSDAVKEVEAVATVYPVVKVLAGPAVNRTAVEDALRWANVVHYAGHAIFDDDRPDRSHLVLAPSRSGEGGTASLSAAGLERLDLRHVRLVVLSACQTARARHGRSGGFAGLAGALLAAGAGGVVGSLWRVDDRLTHALMVEFHGAYRGSGDGAGALREAQLRLLRSPDPALRSPAAWAGFRYAGN